MKMLMEIDPLPMRGSLVMALVMISPSRREVPPVEQLCQSPRLIPPRFRLVAAESRPEKFPLIFSHRKTSYRRRWSSESHQGAHEVGGAPQGGAPPPSWKGCGPPGLHLWRGFFIIYYKVFRGVSGLLELCRIGL